jgi:glycosyltransferase involved in cell wall biosynthesis
VAIGGDKEPAGRPDTARSARVLILNWRDTGHSEGGGSEVYSERVADGLASMGYDVTIFTAAYAGAPADQTRPSGVRVVRRGSHQSVYVWAPLMYRSGSLGRPDAVIEVHNGMPFLARLWARRRTPVVVLVHHVHREQWRVVFGPVRARLGWFLESQVAPRLNRRCRYVAVSSVTRAELAGLGVPSGHVRVVHNGTTPPLGTPVARTPVPSLLVLGRLVPHKRVEIAIETLARLRPEFPGLSLTIAGRGWWEGQLRAQAERLAVTDAVRFAGFVTAEERHELYSQSWVSLMPSLKEGWGLAVVEAGAHATPSVAFHGAGGVSESIIEGVTGLLAERDDVDDYVAKVRHILSHPVLRLRMGDDAATYAREFDWDTTVKAFDDVLAVEVRPNGVDQAWTGPSERPV